MKMTGRCIQLLGFLAMIGLGPWNRAELFAQRALSGAELENGCQVYADKAVKYATEWEQLQCKDKLNLSPQLFDTDKDWQLRRCRNSVGTTIASDLKSMEDDLRKCRPISGQDGGQTGKPGTTGTRNTGWDSGRRDEPRRDEPRRNTPGRDTFGGDGGNSAGEIWDIIVINSADLARSYHTYRIPSLNGVFTAKNMNPAGGPEFKGQMNGSVFEALMTDRTGYRATFIGHGTASGDIEGTGCDNRNRSFSFTMRRQ